MNLHLLLKQGFVLCGNKHNFLQHIRKRLGGTGGASRVPCAPAPCAVGFRSTGSGVNKPVLLGAKTGL